MALSRYNSIPPDPMFEEALDQFIAEYQDQGEVEREAMIAGLRKKAKQLEEDDE